MNTATTKSERLVLKDLKHTLPLDPVDKGEKSEISKRLSQAKRIVSNGGFILEVSLWDDGDKIYVTETSSMLIKVGMWKDIYEILIDRVTNSKRSHKIPLEASMSRLLISLDEVIDMLSSFQRINAYSGNWNQLLDPALPFRFSISWRERLRFYLLMNISSKKTSKTFVESVWNKVLDDSELIRKSISAKPHKYHQSLEFEYSNPEETIRWGYRSLLGFLVIREDSKQLDVFIRSSISLMTRQDAFFALGVYALTHRVTPPVEVLTRILRGLNERPDKALTPGIIEYLKLHKRNSALETCNEFVSKFIKHIERSTKKPIVKKISTLIKNKHYPARIETCGDWTDLILFKKALRTNVQVQRIQNLYRDFEDWFNREAENFARSELGWPKIGEGWVGEINLLNKLVRWFPKYKFVHQWSPKWLGRQRIDIGIPSLGIAIEFHGTQHFEPVEFFGGKQAFNQQRLRDKRKSLACKKNKTLLLVFTEDHTDKQIQTKVSSAIKLRTPNF
jgi:hypothetical protein